MMRNERNTFVKLFKILTFVNVYAFSYIDLVLEEWIISPIKVGKKLAFVLFKKTIQHFAIFSKQIREMSLF